MDKKTHELIYFKSQLRSIKLRTALASDRSRALNLDDPQMYNSLIKFGNKRQVFSKKAETDQLLLNGKTTEYNDCCSTHQNFTTSNIESIPSEIKYKPLTSR